MTLKQRTQAAIRAFQGKPAQSIRLGVNLTRCDECQKITRETREVVTVRSVHVATDPRQTVEACKIRVAELIGRELLEQAFIDIKAKALPMEPGDAYPHIEYRGTLLVLKPEKEGET
jgi:hypothetical protein